jgi:RNA polymerase sigma-70 factor (ECF subfamily)
MKKIILLSEEELIEEAVQYGNVQALNQLISIYTPFISTLLKTLLIKDKDALKDLTQEISISLYQKLSAGKYDHRQRFSSWVKVLTRNQVYDYLRKEKSRKKFIKFQEHDELNDFCEKKSLCEPDIFYQKEAKCSEDNFVYFGKKAAELLNLLPKEQQEVMCMRFFNNMTYNEIAEKTNISIHTLRGRYRLAVGKLKEWLGDFKP